MLVLVSGGIICFVEKKLSGCAAEFVFWLPNRCERRRKDTRELDVVVAYQSYIPRNGDPALDQTAHQPKRQEIIRAKSSGRAYPGA